MWRKLGPAVLLATSMAMTGCVDLPVVGNVGEQLKPVLPEFIRERLFGSEDQASTARVEPVKRLRRRRLGRVAPAAQAGSAGAEAGGLPVAPQENVAALYEQYLTRNMEFDHLRTQGIEQLMSGQTEKAIQSFKAALAKKPGDKSVEDLLQLAENPPIRPLDGGSALPGGAGPGTVPNLPGGAGPGMVPSLRDPIGTN